MGRRADRRRSTAGAVAFAVTALVACADGDDQGGPGELCAVLESGQSRFGSTFADFDPTDPDRALAQLRTARIELGELRDVAPEEVRDELDVEIQGVQRLIEALEGADLDSPTGAVDAIRSIEDELGGMEEATATLRSWVIENCDAGIGGAG